MSTLAGITLGRYVAGTSLVHRLDPRVKILLTAGWLGALFAVDRIVAVGCLTSVAVVVGLWSGLAIRLFLGNLRPLLPLVLLTVLLHGLWTQGETTTVLGIAEISTEGLHRGLFLASRLVAIVIVVAFLTLTTSPLELADGLESLLRPLEQLKVPVHEMALTATIALRFVPILVDEVSRLQNAQLSRGADFGGGPIRRIRSFVPLLVPLFVSAFGRADRLATAMEARCYQGAEGRTRYHELKFRLPEVLALALGLLVAGVVSLAAR